MARAIRWTVPFKSLSGISCRVDIFDEDWTGQVATLEGAANPFEYSEIDDEDLLNTVIRYRTGYLRLFENERGELDEVYPNVNTDRYIEFYYGEILDFNGFIEAQSFEDSWEDGRRVVSLPVISPIGLAFGTDYPWDDDTNPTWNNIRGILYKSLTALDANYTGFIFPQYMETPQDITLVATRLYINSLVFAPYNDQYNKYESPSAQNRIFKPNTVEDALMVICTGFGLILHDVPGTPIFQRVDYQGHYVNFGLIGGATQITPRVMTMALFSSVIGTENTESVVMPLSKIEVTYEGSKSIPSMTFDRCKGRSAGCGIPDNEFCTNEPNIGDFDGTFNEYASIGNEGLITEGNIVLGAYGSGSLDEMILYRAASGWGNGYKICSYTFYEYNGESVRLRFKHLYGDSIENMNNPAYQPSMIAPTWATVGVIVKSGNMYYNPQSGWQSIPSSLTYTKIWNDGREECEVGIGAAYGSMEPRPLVIEFYAVSTNLNVWIQTISDVSLLKYDSASNAYLKKNADPNTVTIKGNPSIFDDAITRGCSIMTYTMNRIRIDGRYVDGTAQVEIMNLEPEYPYLLQKQNRLQVGLKMDYQTPANIYLNRMLVWGNSTWKWRTIARGFVPWNDTHRFTLHHSDIFNY